MEELAPVKVGSQSILLLAWPTSLFDSLSHLLEALAQVNPHCEVLASLRMANLDIEQCIWSDTGQAEVAI